MSNTSLIIEERSRDIGDFLVGRILPFRKKRMVGPFIFVDHMGPTVLGTETSMEVNQHPHIGLATLTYLLEGEVAHEDSIGTKQIIKPGEVNLMVAGKGVSHTERTPEHLKGTTYQMNGYQIWIALPKDKEEMEPEFHHLAHHEIISWQEKGVSIKLIAGEAFQKKSPLPTFSPLFMVEMQSTYATALDLKGQFKGEIGIIITEGYIKACDQVISKGNMMVSKEEDQCNIEIGENSHVFLIGGEPFPEPRFIDWNFVSSDKAKLEQVRKDWKNKNFPMIEGDHSYIPHPLDK